MAIQTRARMTKGKAKNIDACADDRGVIRAAAMDQRGSLMREIGKQGGAGTPESLTEFKTAVTKALRAYGTCPSMSLTRNMKATPTAIETAISITPSAYLTRYRRLSALSCRRLSWNATRSSGLKMDVNARVPAIKMTATTALSSWAIIQSTSEYASELRREPKVTDNSRAGRGRLVRLRAQTWKVCERKLRGFESHPLRRT